MSIRETKLEELNSYVQSLKGDEKGEAQVLCDRLFQAFGDAGYREAGATLEHRVRIGKGTKFADLFWKDTMLLEMKKRGAVLERHYRQAFEYWQYLVPRQSSAQVCRPASTPRPRSCPTTVSRCLDRMKM